MLITAKGFGSRGARKFFGRQPRRQLAGKNFSAKSNVDESVSLPTLFAREDITADSIRSRPDD
jgi:hypothetical protein